VSPRNLRPSVTAAGGILRREASGGRPEYLIVHRPRHGDWSLPKGKLDPKESYLRAALREVWEETGYHGTNPVSVGSIGYDTTAGNCKLVRWWSMTSGKGKFRANSEVDAVQWLPVREARQLLRYRNDRNVLDRANTLGKDPTASTVYLLRHARAGVKRRSGSSDLGRSLDKTGREQASALALELRRVPITRIITSDHRRCVQTLKPLAASLRLKPETDRRMSVDAGPEEALDLLRELGGEGAAISSHGEVIGALLGSLAAEGVDLVGPMEWRKGSMWVLELRRGKVRSGRYLPPPDLVD
jgi:8-oxo-dGTP diphosphatase